MTTPEQDQEYWEATHPIRRKDGPREWHTHAAAAKLCFQRERRDPDFRFFSPGAEHQRSPARAAISKMLGQNRRGLPDLWLLRRNPTAVCVVEFKLPTGRVSPEQREWLEWCPWPCHVVTGLEGFRAVLEGF